MKGLIVGGNQFMTRTIARRFRSEKIDLIWLDKNATSMKGNIQNLAHCIGIDYASDQCETVFKNHHPEIIIFVGEPEQVALDALCPSDMNHHVNGLMYMMSLAVEYSAKRFIYLSTTDLYEQYTQQDEQNPIIVKDAWTTGHATAESFLQHTNQLYGIDILILRISTVYGIQQEKYDSPVSFFIYSQDTKQDRKITSWIKEQSYDLLSDKDFAEAIFNAVYSPATGITNICSGKLYHAADIQRYILSIKNQTYDQELHPISKSYNTDRAAQLFDFTARSEPMYEIIKAVKKTLTRTATKHKKAKNQYNKKEKVKTKQEKTTSLLQTVENILLFGVVAYFVIIKQQTMIFNWIDIRLLYILFMSVQFGLMQSAISSGLCIVLVVYEYFLYEQNLLKFIYNTTSMVSIFMFVFAGVILGYMVDRRKNYIQELESHQSNLEGQLTHTKIMYTESLKIKDTLQQQIYGTNDSFGKIYNIVSKLDSLAIEELNGSIIQVTEEIMKTKAVSMYHIGKNGEYLRLLSRSASLADLPASIKLVEGEPLYYAVYNQRHYVNKSIDENNNYLMVAPIIDNNKVIAVLILHRTSLKYLTLQYENMFLLTARLINQSIILAYKYQKAISEEMLIPDTIILKKIYFGQILEQKRRQQELGSSVFTLLRIDGTDYMKISDTVGTIIRDVDYLGIGQDEKVYVMLSNTVSQSASTVISRLKENEIEAIWCDERIAG